MFKHKKNKELGITLIALIVTIIVLLILAGISISMLSGDNSILQKATDAKIETERAEIEEALKMAYIDQIGKDILNYCNEVSLGNVVNAVKNQGYKVGSQSASGQGPIEDIRLKNGDASIGLSDGQTELEIELVRGTNTGNVYYAEINGVKYEITDNNGNGDIKISRTPLATGTVTEPTITVGSSNSNVATVVMSTTDSTKIIVTPVAKGNTDINVTVEGTSISNKKAGAVTITGPLLAGEKSTETVKDNYTDSSSSKKKATIPAGFTVSGISGEQNIDDGLVIYLIPDGVTPDWTTRATGDAFNTNTVYDIQTKYDQFVWIPVDKTNKRMYKVATAEGYASTDANNPNYEGVFYSFNGSNSIELSNAGQGGSNKREPDTNGCDSNASCLEGISVILSNQAADYTPSTFLATIQKDYNEMVESVEYYGGFWIGRYENSLVDGKTRVIAGRTSINNTGTFTVSGTTYYNNWYTLYGREKKFASDAKTTVTSLDSNLKSGMIWGSQYDAMINWMLTRGLIADSIPTGTSKNSSRITGATKNGNAIFNDKIKNIYDLLGNSYEWTQGASSNSLCRGRYGGYYNSQMSFSAYYEGRSTDISGDYSSRPYIIVSRENA